MRPPGQVLSAAALAVIAIGCGGGGRSAGATADAAAADAGADAAASDLFANPGDFDHTGCDTTTPLDQVKLVDVWHMDMDYDAYGKIPGVIKFEDDGDGVFANIFGGKAQDLRVSATDVFVRRVFTDGGRNRVRAWDACALEADGSLFGRYASCTDGQCVKAVFHAYRVEPLDEPVAENMTLLAEYDGPASSPWPLDSEKLTVNVRHRGSVAYLARYDDGLRMVDLSDPNAPVELGHAPVLYPGQEIYNDVKIFDGPNSTIYALCASNMRGAVVVDVTDPQNPTEVTTFPPPLPDKTTINVHSIFVDGKRAYLADLDTAGIDIFDISDPTRPTRLGAYVSPQIGPNAFVHDLFVENGRASLNYWALGLLVVDASDPTAPKLLGTFDGYPRRKSHSNWATVAGGRPILITGDEDFGAHARIVDDDDSSATFMTEIGSYQTRPQVSVHNIMAVGQTAFVTYYQDGLRVLDLSDPTHPVEIAHYQTWPGVGPGYGNSFYEGAIGVDYDPVSGWIYVADTHRGLLVLTLDH